jgi:hypothetical protein
LRWRYFIVTVTSIRRGTGERSGRILSAQQFNQIMKGEKTAEEKAPRAEKIAELAELNPQVSDAECLRATPPLKRQPDPVKRAQEAPKLPEHAMASPPRARRSN